MSQSPSALFVPLDSVTDRVIEDFVPLLSALSTTFAALDLDM